MFEIVAVGLLLVVLALILLGASRRMRVESGLPSGRVIGSDVSLSTRGKLLYAARYGLSGTPDYLVETEEGIVPVEVKPSRTEKEPRESHLLQVLAYCLLVEETTGKRPPHGLLRYRNDTFKVDYNRETRAHLLSVIEEMRGAAQQREVHRSHEVPGKCWGCAYKSVCEESLA
jgi:CRISPR-associated exonuclease Cas4